MNRRELLAGGLAVAGLQTPPVKNALAAAPTKGHRTTFTPGEAWLDTAGQPIQAHGGSIIQVGEAYYWYGENKEFTTGKTDIWTWGIRCYRSMDLYNWEDLGLIIPPDEHDKSSPLHPHRFIDRPHIVYNVRTRKFVCWIKIIEDPYQTRTALVADHVTGPYRLIRRGLLPVGMSAGDFDLVTSPDDGKGYMYFERVHSEMICADLTEDYTDFTGYYSTHLPRPGPPSVREGLAYFRRHGKHYIASSGTTGYFPNPSEIAVAETFHGPFSTLGDLHPTDRSRTSFNSQISSIFKHPRKKDLYIALADRWMGPMSGPDFESGAEVQRVQNAFAKKFASPPQPLTQEESAAFKFGGYFKVNTSESRYVWLPLRFDGERPFIEWRPEWSLDEFE